MNQTNYDVGTKKIGVYGDGAIAQKVYAGLKDIRKNYDIKVDAFTGNDTKDLDLIVLADSFQGARKHSFKKNLENISNMKEAFKDYQGSLLIASEFPEVLASYAHRELSIGAEKIFGATDYHTEIYDVVIRKHFEKHPNIEVSYVGHDQETVLIGEKTIVDGEKLFPKISYDELQHIEYEKRKEQKKIFEKPNEESDFRAGSAIRTIVNMLEGKKAISCGPAIYEDRNIYLTAEVEFEDGNTNLSKDLKKRINKNTMQNIKDTLKAYTEEYLKPLDLFTKVYNAPGLDISEFEEKQTSTFRKDGKPITYKEGDEKGVLQKTFESIGKKLYLAVDYVNKLDFSNMRPEEEPNKYTLDAALGEMIERERKETQELIDKHERDYYKKRIDALRA